MTHSLGMPSGVITGGLGFMYNGCMGVFDPRPGRAGSIAPGKSRFSSICPTLAFSDGELRLALGAPGGTQIAMGVTQAILNVLDHDMGMLEAVSAPRFSATSDIIDVTNRIPRAVQRALERQGYTVNAQPADLCNRGGARHSGARRWQPRRRRRPRPRRHGDVGIAGSDRSRGA